MSVSNTNTPPVLRIIECTRCQSPQVFYDNMYEIPVALDISLDGGYGMFIDNWQNSDEYNLTLCHKCAHEFCDWMNINLGHGHPRTDDAYCNGWTFVEALHKDIAQLKEKLSDLIYINEHTMIVPFDDYQSKRAQLEELIKLQEEGLRKYEQER